MCSISNTLKLKLFLFVLLSFLGFDDFHLSIHSDMATVAKAMACPESGLEVRDRMWLKITIANAFIGMFPEKEWGPALALSILNMHLVIFTYLTNYPVKH